MDPRRSGSLGPRQDHLSGVAIPAPALATWARREVVTADKLNAATLAPLTYLSNPPRLTCRGVVADQRLPKGQRLYVRWAPSSDINGFTADADTRWFTAQDSGIYDLSASLTVESNGAPQANGDGVLLFLIKRAANGTQTSFAVIREIYEQPVSPQLLAVQTPAFLQAGESIGVALYLDSGSQSSTYQFSYGDAQHTFHARMVGAGATTSFGSPSEPPVAIPDWTDGELLAPADLMARISHPLQTLYNPSRFLASSVLDYTYTAFPNQRRSIPWRGSAFEQSGGWTLGAGGTTATAPQAGVYLVSYFTAVERNGTPSTQPDAAFQVHLVRNSAAITVHHRQLTRTGMWASGVGSELVFLNAGDALSIDLSASKPGITWRNPAIDPSNTEVWHSFSAVMLAPSATSMQG
ncbi:hypothetical protein ACIBCO_22125 [Streptomyces violascens]|uniref:hypothetical protein n=1 Tax=Streptomyces violascens TaxID=67381 RepID=UPI0037B552EE